MNVLTRSISQIFQGAVKAFQTFPAAIGCALAFAIVTIIRIYLDWPQQEAYNFLFNCLHWSFAVGAISSLAISTAAQSRINNRRAFLIGNMLGLLVVAATFLLLYFFGHAVDESSRFAVISGISQARAGVAMLLSILAFIYLAGYPNDQSDFAKSFFMTHKAFFIALIYGLVIMSGASGVAGAVKALLYHGMSYKVYMYIGTFTGFMSFTIFLGYFPDFRKQPRFMEVLFVYIMIPIVIALTAVLLIWSGRTIATGFWPSFIQLSGIATSYAIGGIWLHIMVTHHESSLAGFYRKFYPIAALVILAFEAWALLVQLGKSGLKMTEYSFSLLWIIAVAAALLLIILKAGAHPKIVAITCAIALIAVFPILGYNALPVTAQADRLEKLLISQGMFSDGKIIPATKANLPELALRESITDAVDYLANARDAKLPTWFDKNLRDNEVFISKLGFEQAWAKPQDVYGNGNGGYMGTSVYLPSEAINIKNYEWALNFQGNFQKGSEYVTLIGDRGTYRIYWTLNSQDGIPTLRIVLNDKTILEHNMNDFVDQITKKYPPKQAEPYEASFKDMSMQLGNQHIDLLLVFSNVDINVDPQSDTINYWINLNALYMNEK